MNAQTIVSPARFALLSLSLALALSGCKSKPDDNTINTQVQARLFSDQNLSGQSIQTAVQGGAATLTGNVTSDTARTIAAGDAGQIAGVKQVINNLVVQPEPAGPDTSAQAAVASAPAPLSPAHSMPRPIPAPYAPIVHNSPEPQPAPQQQAQLPPPPPPAPAVHTITLTAGSSIPVRITQNLDSATAQTGDRFTGSIASDIILDGLVVLPQGTPVTGHVDDAHDAGHYKGNSLLSLTLTSIDRHGERIQVSTDDYTREGKGRGKNTAEKVGGGAAVGAILGGIFGGGRGAAIGAAAGGGVGAGANTITRGQQVQIPSETVIRFRLSNPILVHVSSHPDSYQGSNQGLERHDDQ